MDSPELPLKTQSLVTSAGLCGLEVGTERWLTEAKHYLKKVGVDGAQ